MKKYISVIVIIISILTVLSGAVQLVFPAFVLKNVGIEATPVTEQLFATIGMFMICFGGLVIHGVYSASKSSVIILWAAFQKFGASIAVGIGILHGIFNMTSGGVALFDLCSGVLFIYYYQNLKADEIY
jgi:hypothetical protein